MLGSGYEFAGMNLQLENKRALVTGSTAGIGFAIAKALATEGARVIVNGRSEQRVVEAISSIRASVPSARLATRPGPRGAGDRAVTILFAPFD